MTRRSLGDERVAECLQDHLGDVLRTPALVNRFEEGFHIGLSLPAFVELRVARLNSGVANSSAL
jgi:hypothetical protein